MAEETPVNVPIPEEEQQKAREELNARVQNFIKEYGELVAKHKIDFATYPVFSPDGNGGFRVIVQNTPVDMTNHPTKSPVQQGDFVADSSK